MELLQGMSPVARQFSLNIESSDLQLQPRLLFDVRPHFIVLSLLILVFMLHRYTLLTLPT